MMESQAIGNFLDGQTFAYGVNCLSFSMSIVDFRDDLVMVRTTHLSKCNANVIPAKARYHEYSC